MDLGEFPDKHAPVAATWAPLCIEPVPSGYDRFVVGVAVCGQNEHLVIPANSLDRLKCIYPYDYAAIQTISLAFCDAVNSTLFEKGVDGLFDSFSDFPNASLASPRKGEGADLEEIANFWLGSISCLHNPKARTKHQQVASSAHSGSDSLLSDQGDRLPRLVLESVNQINDNLSLFFHEDIRQIGKRKKRTNPSETIIDYSSRRMVANFGTLRLRSFSNSVDFATKLLWDLIVDRDRQEKAGPKRTYELMLHRPPKNDPQFTENQLLKIENAVLELSDQAHVEEISLGSFTNVETMAERLLQVEGVG